MLPLDRSPYNVRISRAACSVREGVFPVVCKVRMSFKAPLLLHTSLKAERRENNGPQVGPGDDFPCQISIARPTNSKLTKRLGIASRDFGEAAIHGYQRISSWNIVVRRPVDMNDNLWIHSCSATLTAVVQTIFRHLLLCRSFTMSIPRRRTFVASRRLPQDWPLLLPAASAPVFPFRRRAQGSSTTKPGLK